MLLMHAVERRHEGADRGLRSRGVGADGQVVGVSGSRWPANKLKVTPVMAPRHHVAGAGGGEAVDGEIGILARPGSG